MAHLQVIPENRADGDVKRIFEEIRREKRLPFVPNFFKTLALAPRSLEATWMAYRGITTQGALPEALKEMIFVAISIARECKYCEAAHLAFCNLLSVEADDLVALKRTSMCLNRNEHETSFDFQSNALWNPAVWGIPTTQICGSMGSRTAKSREP